MIGFYIRPDDWRAEQAYWAEIQAEEDLAREHKQRKQEELEEYDKTEDKNPNAG